MKKTILIAPVNPPSPGDFSSVPSLATALAEEARSSSWRVVLARVEGATRPGEPRPGPADALRHPEDPDFLDLPWNPSSYISASALLLAARNAFGDLDAVILVQDAKAERSDLIDGKPGALELELGRETAGPALLVREVLKTFDAKKAGSLLLASSEGETGPVGPCASLAVGAFRGLGEGLFDLAKEAPWEAFGIVDKGSNPPETARFALRLLEDKKGGKAGRWLKFTGKPGLFGVFQA